MDEPDDPPSMLGDTDVVLRLQRSCPTADADDAVQSHANGR
jgi:hypothetical protein